MKIRDVVIIGDGIAGCAAALALAKQGIGVTLVASSSHTPLFQNSFISKEKLERMLTQWQEKIDHSLSCSRAYEHLVSFGQNNLSMLFDASLGQKNSNLYFDLKEQLQSFNHVEWLNHHHLVEFLTLDQHSVKLSDRCRKTTCLGAVVYDEKKQEVEVLLSKETILASGGFPAFFPCSITPFYGIELAIAQQAGVRLLSINRTDIYPLALFQKNQPCLPLPLTLLKEGGKLYQKEGILLNLDTNSSTFAQDFYECLLKKGLEYAWLDLSLLDPAILREKVPAIEEYCARVGVNLAKDFLPVAPAVKPLYGGIAVDRVGQTSLHHLRAVGEIACTGLFWKAGEEAFSLLESLTWAVACAEELAKQINRLVYYFPEIKKPNWILKGRSIDDVQLPLEEDWRHLHHTVGAYLGIKKNKERIERGRAFLDQLRRFNAPPLNMPVPFEQMQLFYAIQAAELMV